MRKCNIGEIAKVTSGGTPSRATPSFWGGEIPWVKTTEINYSVIRDTEEKITSEGLKNSSAKLFPAGTILMAMIGQGRTRGQVGLLGIDASTSQNAAAILLDPEIAETNYVYQQLSFRYNEIRKLSNSGNHKNLNADLIRTIAFPIPDKSEQRKIASILSTWDRAIEALEYLIAAKSDRKRSHLQLLLTGRKRLPGFHGKWPIRKLGDLAQNSAVTNRGKHGWGRLYGVTKAEGMTPMREHVRGASNERCKLVKPGWFAYNPMRLNIGSLARWQGDDEVMVSGDYVVFRCLEGKLDPRYFDHLRRSHVWTMFVSKSGSGSVRVRLYFKDIARFKIPCPPIEEQTAIADLLDTFDRELALHRQQLEALREQKRGLMQKLLTGEVRVK